MTAIERFMLYACFSGFVTIGLACCYLLVTRL